MSVDVSSSTVQHLAEVTLALLLFGDSVDGIVARGPT